MSHSSASVSATIVTLELKPFALMMMIFLELNLRNDDKQVINMQRAAEDATQWCNVIFAWSPDGLELTRWLITSTMTANLFGYLFIKGHTTRGEQTLLSTQHEAHGDKTAGWNCLSVTLAGLSGSVRSPTPWNKSVFYAGCYNYTWWYEGHVRCWASFSFVFSGVTLRSVQFVLWHF